MKEEVKLFSKAVEENSLLVQVGDVSFFFLLESCFLSCKIVKGSLGCLFIFLVACKRNCRRPF